MSLKLTIWFSNYWKSFCNVNCTKYYLYIVLFANNHIHDDKYFFFFKKHHTNRWFTWFDNFLCKAISHHIKSSILRSELTIYLIMYLCVFFIMYHHDVLHTRESSSFEQLFGQVLLCCNQLATYRDHLHSIDFNHRRQFNRRNKVGESIT